MTSLSAVANSAAGALLHPIRMQGFDDEVVVLAGEQPRDFRMPKPFVGLDARLIFVALLGDLLHDLAHRGHLDPLIDDLFAQLGRVRFLLQHCLELEDVGLEPVDLSPQPAEFAEFLANPAPRAAR